MLWKKSAVKILQINQDGKTLMAEIMSVIAPGVADGVYAIFQVDSRY